jgi:predicted MFS family arabinose efflux permease
VLVGQRRQTVIVAGLVMFGMALLAFAMLRNAAAAYPVVFLVGLFYFATVTSLSTRLQEHLSDEVRGRVMALYMMSFGGTVPLGLLVAGPIASATSVSAVLVAGAIAACLLAGCLWVTEEVG